jgi:hypothetical protein
MSSSERLMPEGKERESICTKEAKVEQLKLMFKNM